SSRRRHTRCYRDWSSDVCSSDLFSTGIDTRPHPSAPSVPTGRETPANPYRTAVAYRSQTGIKRIADSCESAPGKGCEDTPRAHRSEERRVGKEGRMQEGRDRVRG